MSKSEVYSWRLSTNLKAALEEAARAEGISVSELLDNVVSRWMREHASSDSDEDAQRRLHTVAAASFGSIRGGNPMRSTKARDHVRKRLQERHRRT